MVTPRPVIVSGSTRSFVRFIRCQLPVSRTSTCNVVAERAGTPQLFVKHRTLALPPTIDRSCCALDVSEWTCPPGRSHHMPPSPMTCLRFRIDVRTTGLSTRAGTTIPHSTTTACRSQQSGFTHGVHPASVGLGFVVNFLVLGTPHLSHGDSCVCLRMAPHAP